MTLEVVKTHGKTEPFNPEKVRASVLRSGVSEELADRIVAEVERRGLRLKTPVTTSQIYRWVNTILEKESPSSAMRYDLRDALLKLGPTGFLFEKYIAQVMAAYGYKTELPDILQGACITHEVDVAMEKDRRLMMVEAKFRKEIGIQISIKDTMSTWARFLDLVEGASLGLTQRFDEAWLVTNATFSDQSLEFGHCKNMVMLGWNHPRERTLARMIDIKRLYPITILKHMTEEARDLLVEKDILLVSQLPKALVAKEFAIPEAQKTALKHDCALLLEVEEGGLDKSSKE
jgi:hypothetical protein